MLPKIIKNLRFYGCRFLLLLASFCFFSFPAFAADETVNLPGGAKITNLSAQDMLVNIAKSIPQLTEMVTAIAYVVGMYFIIMGVVGLKHLGESRTMMSQDRSVKGPLILLAVGAALLYLPTSVQVGMSTFWTAPNPYGYVEEEDQWSQFLGICYLIVQFVGTIAFIRGLVILSHLSGHGQQGTFGKGLAHVIGGILCINIYETVQVVNVTLGLQ